MFEVFGPELGGMLALALWVYAIFDVIATDDVLIRNLPKGLWLMIVIFIPDIGSLAWLFLGRPQYAGWRPGDTSVRQPRRVVGVEDDPRWSAKPAAPSRSEAERLKAWEDDLKRREAALEKPKDDGDGKDGDFPFTW